MQSSGQNATLEQLAISEASQCIEFLALVLNSRKLFLSPTSGKAMKITNKMR